MSGVIKKDPVSGKYEFVVDLGRKPDGKRRQVRRRGFEKRHHADAALTDLKKEYKDGDLIDDNKVTVGECLEEWYAGHKKATGLKTWHEYGKKMRG